MTAVRKAGRFLGLLAADPSEAFSRLEVYYHVRKQRLASATAAGCLYPEKMSYAETRQLLSARLGVDLEEYEGEAELRAIEERVRGLLASQASLPLPFPVVFNADSTLLRLAYLLCRAVRPATVLETGVGYGVTSAALLAGMERNGGGTLHSVDLPPLADSSSRAAVGLVVPERFRGRWRLHFGSSKRVLPRLLAGGVGPIDLFLHDSANVYAVQKKELELVGPRLASPGAVIMNNIGKNPAFREFVEGRPVDSWWVIEQAEKRGDLTGVILRG